MLTFRVRRGEEHRGAKLTEQIVCFIRRAPAVKSNPTLQQEIQETFGVAITPKRIGAVRHNKCWRHVKVPQPDQEEVCLQP